MAANAQNFAARRLLDHPQAQHVLIEARHLRQVGDDEMRLADIGGARERIGGGGFGHGVTSNLDVLEKATGGDGRGAVIGGQESFAG